MSVFFPLKKNIILARILQKNTMRATILIVIIACSIISCKKEISVPEKENPVPATGQFINYIIEQGAHYCNQAGLRLLETSELKFTVRFDSSAMYQTQDPENQDDINKLYGFSDDNKDHHQFSARFGWRWSSGALRLFGYVYNAGTVESRQISSIPIGVDIYCSIRVTSTQYIFTANNISENLPRLSTTPKAKGYQLYPYFGGNEAAPHRIRIMIREES